MAWFPRLLHAKQDQLLNYELSVNGIHWDEIDEDISIDGLLAGRGDSTHNNKIQLRWILSELMKLEPMNFGVNYGGSYYKFSRKLLCL